MGPPLLPSVTARSGETTSGAACLRFVSFSCVNRTARQFVREDADDSLDRLETKGRREAPRRCTRETLRGAPSARGVNDASPRGSLTSFTGEVDYRVRVGEGPVEQMLHPSEDRVPYLSVSESHRRVGRRPGRVGTRSRRGCRVAPARRRPISRRVAAPLMGVRPAPPEGSSAPSSVGAVNRTVSPRISRGVRLDPTKVGAHLPRLAVPTERYGRGCPEVSVLIRRRFVRSSPRLALPTERYRRGCSEVSVLIRRRFVAHLPRLALPTERYRRGCSGVSVSIRRRFVRTLIGWPCQPNGIVVDPPRCPS